MRVSRRVFAGVTILGIILAVIVMLQRRGDAPAEDRIDSGLLPTADAGTTPQFAPDATPTASTMGSGDEVAGACTQTITDAADFATVERNAANPGSASSSNEDWMLAELGKLQRNTTGSRDPDFLTSLLTALFLSSPDDRTVNDPPAQAKLLDLGTRATRSNSPLLAWHALRACAAAKQFCPFLHLEQRLLEADRQNAEAWAMVATLRYERGDVAGALAAMQGAARAPTSTWYWTETIALVERSLATQTDIPFPGRPGTAFGAAASALPPQSDLLNMCKVESAANRAWGEACLAFGTVRGEHNQTEAAQGIAYSIRVQALKALGESERDAQVEAELALFQAERHHASREPRSSMLRLQQTLIETDPARFQAFLDAIQKSGERLGPGMFLRQELPPLLERAGLLERDGVRECVARFFAPRASGGTRSAEEHQIQIADELYISMRSVSGGFSNAFRVEPDGKIRMSGTREFAAVGKTTAQLRGEIATMFATRYPSPQVLVIWLPSRSPEELRRDFDDAWAEKQRREP